jgi:hypothetical protein
VGLPIKAVDKILSGLSDIKAEVGAEVLLNLLDLIKEPLWLTVLD